MNWLAAMALLLVAGFGYQRGAAGDEPAGAAEPATEAWGRVLELAWVDGGLDYELVAGQRQDLDLFLARLAHASPASWPADRQNAFWINAYNAVVVEFVLRRYPGLESVKEVSGFFDRETFPVAGEQLTLDEIETRSRELGDARVHFAVVCASTSCPDLRSEPYDGERLDEQLEEQTRAFLARPDKGLRYDSEANVLWLSSIFKWYAGDFTGGSTVVAYFARGGVRDWVLPHLPAPLAATLRQRSPAVRYMDYDWSLNDRRR